MDTVMVTGGAGFIGSFLVEQLLKNKKVVVLDNFKSGSIENLKHVRKNPRLKIIQGDVLNQFMLKKFMKGINVIYHLAVEPLPLALEDPFSVHQTNSTGTLNCLYALYANNTATADCRFNYISSSEIYGSAVYTPMDEVHPKKPRTVYAASKLVGEHYTRAFNKTFGLPYTIIRPFNTYGPRHRTDAHAAVFIQFIKNLSMDLRPKIFGDGAQTRDFTYVTDTAKGICLCGESPLTLNNTLNIGQGEETSVNDMAKIILELYNSTMVPEYLPGRKGDVLRHCVNSAKAKQLVNFMPRVALKEGLLKTKEWFENECTNNWC